MRALTVRHMRRVVEDGACASGALPSSNTSVGGRVTAPASEFGAQVRFLVVLAATFARVFVLSDTAHWASAGRET